MLLFSAFFLGNEENPGVWFCKNEDFYPHFTGQSFTTSLKISILLFVVCVLQNICVFKYDITNDQGRYQWNQMQLSEKRQVLPVVAVFHFDRYPLVFMCL